MWIWPSHIVASSVEIPSVTEDSSSMHMDTVNCMFVCYGNKIVWCWHHCNLIYSFTVARNMKCTCESFERICGVSGCKYLRQPCANVFFNTMHHHVTHQVDTKNSEWCRAYHCGILKHGKNCSGCTQAIPQPSCRLWWKQTFGKLRRHILKKVHHIKRRSQLDYRNDGSFHV